MTTEELLETVEEFGELAFSDAGDANIPVSIFMTDDEIDFAHKWQLTADNYMPRKGIASDCAYKATAPTREALVEVVRKYILPLYQTAIANLDGIIAGTNDSLYYWDIPVEDVVAIVRTEQ